MVTIKVPFGRKKYTGVAQTLEEAKTLASGDLKYTLVEGEKKKNYCKIMMNTRIATGDRPFALSLLQARLQTYGKKRVEQRYGRSVREGLEKEEAEKYIRDLIQDGYLQYVTTQRKDAQHPNVPESGIKYYIFNKFRVIECQESRYFQQKMRQQEVKSESVGKLPEKRCRALRQIYAQFGDKVPFTYQMVTNMAAFYKRMAMGEELPEKKYKKALTDDSKQYYLWASKNAESNRDDFIDTWNSLIRNNYVVPYKVRTKDGTIKVREGAYKVNMVYVRRCLSEYNA